MIPFASIVVNHIRHARDCMKNPTREVDRKQKTIAIGKGCENDLNVISMKIVEFNRVDSYNTCKDDNFR